AADPFHREEQGAVGVDADVVDRHHGGMLELGLHPRLEREALARGRSGAVAPYHLDGDLAAGRRVGVKVYLTHSSAAEQLARHVALLEGGPAEGRGWIVD